MDVRSTSISEFKELNKIHNPKDHQLIPAKVTDFESNKCPFCKQIYEDEKVFNGLSVYDSDKFQRTIKHCPKDDCVTMAYLSQAEELSKCLVLPYWPEFNNEKYNSDKHGKCWIMEIRWSSSENKGYVRCASSSDNTIYYRDFDNFSKFNQGALEEILDKIEWPRFYPESLKQVFIDSIKKK